MLGLTPFWATVVRVELINLASRSTRFWSLSRCRPRLWVVITGGILGIVAMRLVVGQLIALVQRYPALVDGAFIIIAWVGLKLCLEYLHEAHVIALDIPKWLSLGIVVVIFIVALIYARMQGAVGVENGDALAHEAEEMLAADEKLVAKIDGDLTK